MKANAPEKLYLSKNIYSTYLYQVPDPDDETTVEYIRKDVFIEKACLWLSNVSIEDMVYKYDDFDTSEGRDEFVKDFKKYMEE